MRISVPKEIMNNEHRVALTPTEVRTLVTDGHELFIESGAGAGASFPDEEYVEAGGHHRRFCGRDVDQGRAPAEGKRATGV